MKSCTLMAIGTVVVALAAPLLAEGARPTKRRAVHSEGPREYARTDADCERMGYCAEGLCGAREGKCVQRNQDDCERHAGYLAHDSAKPARQVFFVNGKCVHKATPRTDEDCVTWHLCRDEGRCRAVGGKCVASSGEDCAASVACRASGRCSARSGRCVVGSEADCRRSERMCAENGLCSMRKGRCEATNDADCRGAMVCKREGACTAWDGWCTTKRGKPNNGLFSYGGATKPVVIPSAELERMGRTPVPRLPGR